MDRDEAVSLAREVQRELPHTSIVAIFNRQTGVFHVSIVEKKTGEEIIINNRGQWIIIKSGI